MQKRKRKLQNPVKFLSLLPAVLFALFLFGMMTKTTGNGAADTIKRTPLSAEGFAELSNRFEESLQSQCYEKEFFVNLNGWTTKLLGIHTLNGRVKTKDGFLAFEESSVDISYPAKQVIALNDFLKERDIDFLYMLAPTAVSIYDAQLAPGYQTGASQNIEDMMIALEQACVPTINADALYRENGLHSQDVLFYTDHHWRPEAAFFVTHHAMRYMADAFDVAYDDSMADFSQWEVTVYEHYFLGSHGKAVGSKYAGTDDISLIRRKGQGDVSFSCLHKDSTDWSYRNSVFEDSHLSQRDYFHLDPYSVYIGGTYPQAVIRNEKALNLKKIMVIGDSFRRPVESFLTSYFGEVYHIDSRYNTDKTIVRWISEIQPDIVLMCTYENGLQGKEQYEFGLEEYLAAKVAYPDPEELLVLGDVHLDGNGDDKHFQVLVSNLEPNTPYTLTIDGAALQGDEGRYVQMTLQDLSDSRAVCNQYYETDLMGPQKWLFSAGEEGHTYAIYLYAGTKGHTAGVTADVTGVRLQKGFP